MRYVRPPRATTASNRTAVYASVCYAVGLSVSRQSARICYAVELDALLQSLRVLPAVLNNLAVFLWASINGQLSTKHR